ncbi:MAG: hypothetical protein R3A47_10745 [Polyangiales bacterium]
MIWFAHGHAFEHRFGKQGEPRFASEHLLLELVDSLFEIPKPYRVGSSVDVLESQWRNGA